MKKSSILLALLGLSWTAMVVTADEPAPQPVAESGAAVTHVGAVEGCANCGHGAILGRRLGRRGGHGAVGGHGVYPGRVEVVRNAVHDRNHPAPFYAHGRQGRDATWTNDWNREMAASLPWHGGYYYPAYGAPTALVLPPTASFISNYGWGVGNVTSTPIYHQFERPYPGPATGGTAGMFQAPPLWPSHTNQFGIYPVRGPW